jgi:hypothetical protein
MSWYMAVIVRGSFTEAGLDREHMGDLLYKLVEAPNAEAAFEKAVALGEAAVDTYNDEVGAEMSLRYLGLADLMELAAGPPGDGVEVYSQAVNAKPWERVLVKEALTVFQRWEIPEGEEEELGEVTEVGEIAEPGAERFRAPARED